MITNENGITLISLVITIVLLSFLASILVDLSLQDNGMINSMHSVENSYYDQKDLTQNRIDDMTNGWEDILQ